MVTNPITLAIRRRHVPNSLDADCFTTVQAANALGVRALFEPLSSALRTMTVNRRFTVDIVAKRAPCFSLGLIEVGTR